jgi:hypothetical protein
MTTASETQHTPEPWKVYDGRGGYIYVGPAVPDDPVVAVCHDYLADSAANARRIVACVNACAGIPTEELDSSIHRLSHLSSLYEVRDTLCTQNAALLAALKAVRRECRAAAHIWPAGMGAKVSTAIATQEAQR